MSFFIGDPKYQKPLGTTKTHTQGEHSPFLVRRGGCGIKKISAKPTLAPQTGWSLTLKSSARTTTPSAPSNEASRHFLTVASTPLKELDVMRVLPQLSSPFVLRTFLVSGNVVVDYAFQVSQRRFRQKAAESSRGDKRSEPVCEPYS